MFVIIGINSLKRATVVLLLLLLLSLLSLFLLLLLLFLFLLIALISSGHKINLLHSCTFDFYWTTNLIIVHIKRIIIIIELCKWNILSKLNGNCLPTSNWSTQFIYIIIYNQKQIEHHKICFKSSANDCSKKINCISQVIYITNNIIPL